MSNGRSHSVGMLAFMAAVGAFLAAFLVYPLLYVFKEAFWIEGRFSLDYFAAILRDTVSRRSIGNSFLLGITSTAATTLVAVPLALIAARLSFRGKSLISGLLLVPMIMPPFVGAIGMRQLLARGGSVNLLIQKFGLPEIDFLGAGGFWAVVVLEVLHLYPIMYLNVSAALANVDPAMEEAARNMGDSGFRLFRKITFPLMLPGYFAGAVLVFIWAFTDLGTPLIFNFRDVIAVQIFDSLSDLNTNPIAYALVVLVVLLAATAFLAGRIYVGGRGYEMLSKGATARRERQITGWPLLGVWALMLGVLGLALLPHLGVFFTAFAGRWSGTVLPSEYTAQWFGQAVHHDLAMRSVWNSLRLSLVSTLLDIVLGVGIAYILVRRRFQGAHLLDALAMMPLAIPGIVLAFGYMASFRGTAIDARINPFPLLVVAYGVRRLPYMVRAAYAGFQQTSVTLEEAAMNVGATPSRALFKITVPLILANIIAGAVLTFAFAMLEVSDSLILATREMHYPLTKAIFRLFSLPGEGDFLASAMGVMAMVLLAGTLLIAGKLLGKRMGQIFRV